MGKKKPREEPKPPPMTDEERLLETLRTGTPEAREAAAREISGGKGWRSPTGLAEALVERLSDGAPGVRAAAVEALGSLGEDALFAVDEVVKALERNPDLLPPAAGALRRMGLEGVERVRGELLPGLIGEEDPERIRSSAALIARLGPAGERLLGPEDVETARSSLMAMLGGWPRNARLAAVDALLLLGPPPMDLLSMIEISELSEEEKAEIRDLAMRDAGRQGPEPSGADGERQGAWRTSLPEKVFLTVLAAIPVAAVAGGAVAMTVLLGPRQPAVAATLWLAAVLVAAGIVLWWWRCPSCGRFFAGKRIHSITSRSTETERVRTASGGSANVQVTRSVVIRWYRCKNCGHVFRR